MRKLSVLIGAAALALLPPALAGKRSRPSLTGRARAATA